MNKKILLLFLCLNHFLIGNVWSLVCKESGTYLKTSSDTVCSLCQVGKYSVFNDEPITSCKFCNAGSYQSGTGASKCTLCEIGTHTNMGGASVCQECPPTQTTYNPNTNYVLRGMTYCSVCPDGKYLNKSSEFQCLDCLSPGTYFCKGGSMQQCATPIPEHQYISKACDKFNDAVVSQCSNCSTDSYISSSCTSTTDTICSQCTQCNTQYFSQYVFSECTANNNTICSNCNSSAGDMKIGLGICNPCPAGSSITPSGKGCTLCSPGKYSALINAQECIACESGLTSAIGATRCVKQCPEGYYNPSGDAQDQCIPHHDSGFQSMIVASVDPMNIQQISAAAPVINSKSGITINSFLVATKKPFAYSSEIWLISKDMAWSIAGNGYYSSSVSDGKGAEASFALITSITLKSGTGSYLLTEYDPTTNSGFLRSFTLLVSADNVEGQAHQLIEYSPQTLHKVGKWIWPAQAVYNSWQDTFLVMDIGLNSVVQIQIQPTTHIITSCIILISAAPSTTLYYDDIFFNPLSLSIFHHQGTNHNGAMVLLDGGRIIYLKGHESAIALSASFLTNSLKKNTLCGGGWKTLKLEQGASLACNEIDFSKSGAKQILLTTVNDEGGGGNNIISDTQDTFVIYILMTSPSSLTESAIAQITIPPTTVSSSTLQVSIFWVIGSQDSSMVVTSSSSIPLHFVPNFIGSSSTTSVYLQSLYMIESRGIIKRLGGGKHHTTSTPCFCNTGLYCDFLNSRQCLDAPLGTYTDDVWTTDPIKCPENTIGHGCSIECPMGFVPNFYPAASNLDDQYPWYCQSACQNGYVFDATSKECLLGGCKASQGLYYDKLKENCVSCWLGSSSTGGEGPESCVPCSPGTYGKTSGKCEVCPVGTTTWSYGSTLCMPDLNGEVLLTVSQKYCADGVLASSGGGGCPPFLEVPSSVMPIFALNSTIVSLTGSSDGLLFMISSTSLYLYDLVNAVFLYEALTDPQIFHFLQVCETCLDQNSVIPKGILYHTSKLGTCVFRTTLHSSSSTTEIFKGDCTTQGQATNGLLPQIHSMTLMETDQLSPILYISTLTSHCAEIFSISTYDGTITSFASQDALHYPISLLNVCFLFPPVLAASKGVNGILYAALNDKVYATQVTGPGALPEKFLKDTSLIYQVGMPGSELSPSGTRIIAITIQHLTKNNNQHHIVVVTQNGNVHSIPVSAFTLGGGGLITTLIYTHSDLKEDAASIIALIGRRLWYVDDGQVNQLLLSNIRGCVGGFAVPETDQSIQGICMQAGKGFYTDFDHGNLNSCPPGTLGMNAGASLQLKGCQACPDGTIAPFSGSAFCTHCPPGFFSNPSNTECVTTCPLGTLRPDKLPMSCVPCQPGFSTSLTSSICMPCSEGTFSNANTSWQCAQCPEGYTSPKGAHNCVRICSDHDTCALDGEQCISLSQQYKILSQIFTANTGQSMVGLTVDTIGGVFYTNGNNIRYYYDDCPSYLDVCNKEGGDLLSASQYLGYRFTSLAICNRATPPPSSNTCYSSSPTQHFKTRRLYIASLTYSSIFILNVCQDQITGVVDLEATKGGSGLILLAGSNWAGFADGPFTSALFNQPIDLELNAQCDLLYLSDFSNHRIRRLNLTSSIVTTVAGMSATVPCWKMGDALCSSPIEQPCLSSDSTCGAIKMPMGIGLSKNERDLFIVGNTINSVVKITNVLGGAKSNLEYNCRFAFSNRESGTVQQCNLNAPKSKGCMLFRAFDVTVVDDYEMYVGVAQGITKIYSEDGGNTFLCQQIAGNFYDISTYGLRDGIKPSETSGSDMNVNSLVNTPYKLAFAKDRGVLYFADYNNGAIRRVMVKPACVCPVGTSLLQSAASCYNPSPFWSKKALPICTPGYYALEGDLQCFRKCSDAIQQGLSAAPCLIAPNTPQFSTLSYSQLLGDLSPPQSSLQADWYGSIPSASGSDFAWNSIFQSTDLGSTISYKQGKIPGRAPSGRNFVSLTYSPTRKCWFEESIFSYQPVLILPGLWFPCQKPTTDGSTCSCPTGINAFEPLPTNQAEKEAQSIAPKRWQALRAAATLSQAIYMDPDPTKNCNHDPYAAVNHSLPSECTIQSRSIFMIFGTPETPASSTACPDNIADGGPCFPTFMHHNQKQSSPQHTLTPEYYTLPGVMCYLGWPAHYYCPNGYIWIAPSPSQAITTCNPVSEQVTCLSCLPGTFAYLELSDKQKTGGPYICHKCNQGTFSSSVASSVCTACPVGKYASMKGATTCESCSAGKYTVVPKAYSPSQCVDCLPGTGNCSDCVQGTYQHTGGQIMCLITPPGFFTAVSNASEPVPCPPGFYQNTAGQTTCLQCDQPSSFTYGYGATTCIACSALNCSMALGNSCGQGCGLNQYWDNGKCNRCPNGTINAYDPCSMDAESCWQNPRKDFYVSSLTQEVTACPYGSQANYQFDGCEVCKSGFNSDSTTQGCKKCQIGKYAPNINMSACVLCEGGKANSAEGMVECYDCLPGSFSTLRRGSSNCSLCPAGQYANAYGSVMCKLCDYGKFNVFKGMRECNETCDASEGYYSLPGDTACKYCEGGIINVSHLCQGCGLGQYVDSNNDNDTRQCLPCPVGLVNLNNTNAASIAACIPCASPTAFAASTILCVESSIGYVPNTTGNGQMPCPRGTFRNASLLQCTPCLAGQYMNQVGSDTCSICEQGKYAPEPGQMECAECSIGSIARESGALECQNCPVATYEVGRIQCKNCPENTYSIYPKQGSCASCDPKTFSLMGSSNCSYCPVGKVLNSNRKCDLCSPGKYMAVDSQASRDLKNPIYKCAVCRPGKFMPYPSGGEDPPACSYCSSGKVALTEGASNCTACPPGEVADNTSTSLCVKCQTGKYGPDGLRCEDCPPGGYSNALGMSRCLPCSPGYYQDTHSKTVCNDCSVGTFSNASGATICMSCLVDPNTFNALPRQSVCQAKLTQCNAGQYINHSDSPLRDHNCLDCLPCEASQSTIILKQFSGTSNLILDTPDDIIAYTNKLCKGWDEAPHYICVDNKPRAGEYLSFDQYVGGSSLSTTTSFNFVQCQNPQYNAKKVTWVAGKDLSQCYVACLYGINSSGLLDYRQKYIFDAEKEDANNNIFLERLLDTHVNAVCLSCPLASTCPRGRFRPKGELNELCGPECGIPKTPPLCTNPEEMASGCIANCTNAPSNADYLGGSQILGSNTCSWVCNFGWHISDDGKNCLPCPDISLDGDEAAANQVIAATCGSSDFVFLPKEQCLYWHTSMHLCKPCPQISNGRSVGWDNTSKQCKYQCHRGYFLNTTEDGEVECVQCTLVWALNLTICPEGMYLDQESCFLHQETPICKSCNSKPSIRFTSNGGLNASECRGICPPGFHTVSQSTAQYFSYSSQMLNKLPFVPDVKCVQCTPSDQRTCLQSNTSICFEGYYRNLSVSADQVGSCIPCRQKDQCGGGFYYTNPCSGTEIMDTPCLPCPLHLLKDSTGEFTTKKFISYENLATLSGMALMQVISKDYCPRVCLNNFARDPLHTDQCITCKSMAFDLQNSIDPSKITLENNECIKLGTEPSACSFIYSHWNATPALPWWDMRTSTPWMANKAPNIIINGVSMMQRAGLCWACPGGMTTGTKDNDLCTLTPGYISPSENLPPPIAEAIPSLPADISIAVMQSPLVFNVNYLTKKRVKTVARRLLVNLNVSEIVPMSNNNNLITVNAQPCPIGYYKPSAGEGKCFVCPLGTSTIKEGSISKDACMCKYGYYRTVSSNNNMSFFCLPCPEETFNNVSISITSSFSTSKMKQNATFSKIDDAILRQGQCTPCPPNHTTYGNEGATRCVCALGMIMDSESGKCTLCPVGYYCKPCSSNCTGVDITQYICFPGSTSPSGSYDVNNCTCSPGMVKKSRPRNPSLFYCQKIPMGGEYNSKTGDITCQNGWTAISKAEDGSVTECALCSLGYYGTMNENGIVLTSDNNSIKPLCQACPKGFYISSRYGIGMSSCTACPAHQTTISQGATSFEQCICPPSMAKDTNTGNCVGCKPNQFVDPSNSSLCKDCPPNAIAQTGANSLSQCMCNPGFYSFTSVRDNMMKCALCPIGKYSNYASVNKKECRECPTGSTTMTSGSTSLTACALCISGYTMREGVGCFKNA